MTNARKSVLLHGLTAVGGLAAALLLTGAVRGEAVPYLRPKAPEGYVAERTLHTTVYAPTPLAAREGQRELRYARERFRDLFGEKPVSMAVVLANDPEQFRGMDVRPLQRRGGAFLPFVTRAHLDARAGLSATDTADGETTTAYRAASGRLTRVKPLAHEACHLFVAALADRVTEPWARTGRAYGHAALPDWLDEAAATLCESNEGRATRRRHFRANLHRRIPLREFANMPHPLSADEVLDRLGIDRSQGQTGVHFIPAEQARKVLPGTSVAMFYAQSLSLGEFILHRGGPDAMLSLVRPLANGRTLEQALREARRAAPGLPATVDELEVEWIRWVERGR